jgi:alanyl-tRNA synthetase
MKKYWDDAYVFSFEAKIADIIQQGHRLGLVFDATYFYPEGGGQPSDRGTIAGRPVSDIQEADDLILHYIPTTPETEKSFSRGMVVPCEIDREYRIHNMRLHTACHLLFGAARKLFSDVGYAGFNIGEVGNLYLETPGQMRAEDLRTMSRLANEVVVENRTITSYFVDTNDARKMKNLASNMEFTHGQVRIIEVDGWDVAACGGTHMHNTLELGPIKVVAREVHKKNVTRIDYAIGKRAVTEISKEEKIIGETAEFLGSSKEQVSQIVRKLSTDLQSAQKDVRKIRERLLDYRVMELKNSGLDVNGTRLIVDVADDLDADSVRAMVTKLLAGSPSTVVAIVGGSDDLSVAAGCSPDLKLVLSPTIVEIAQKYMGGGGGRPNFVMAGRIKCGAPILVSEIKSGLIKLMTGE